MVGRVHKITVNLVVKGDAVSFEVFARPRAKKSEIAGIREGRLDVRLAAPPVDGAANEELARTLALALEVPKSRIELLRGASGRTKLVSVRGLGEDVVRARLARFAAPSGG
jgi:uncharacterized protein (TIGR00251 family)